MIASRILFPLLALSTLAGCGDGLATVSGTVTLNGNPIAGGPQMAGMVNFYPESGSGVSAVGMIDESGEYELKSGARNGVAPGAYLVAISVSRITIPTNPDDMPQPTLITPKRYASVTESGLRADVKPGDNTFDFAINSQPRK